MNLLKQQVTEFVVEFIKILIQTNIYSQDHPLVKQRIDKPYELLKKLNLPLKEFSFILVYSFDKAEEISIEGPTQEAMAIDKLIISSMAGHFIKRLKEYFEKNKVVSLTIKQKISQEHFIGFLSLFTGAIEGSSFESDFSKRLLDNGIVDISVLLLDEIIGIRRRLSWRVRMAIGRLRKDLKNIPLYAKASKEQLKVAKENIIRDIIRPLIRPDFIKELLVNGDLIRQGLDEVQNIQIEDEIINILEGNRLMSVIWDAIGSVEEIKLKYDDKLSPEVSDTMERLNFILKRLALKLSNTEDKNTFDILSYLFKHEFLSFEDLPYELQIFIKREEWTGKFLNSPESTLKAFFFAKTAERINEFIYTFFIILPELVKRREYKWIGRLLLIFENRAIEPEFNKHVEQNMEKLDIDMMFDEILSHVDKLNKEYQAVVFKLLDFLKEKGINFMVTLLRKSSRMSIRRAVCAHMSQIGEPMIPFLLRALDRSDLEWFVLRNIIMVLGNIAHEGAFVTVAKYARHPNGRIREEALTALFKIKKEQIEDYIIDLLDDEFKPVRKKTLLYLAAVGTKNSHFIDIIYNIVRPKSVKEKDEEHDMLDVALTCIESAGNLSITPDLDFADLLSEAINPKYTWWKIKLWGTGFKPKPEKDQIRICKLLAKIGKQKNLKLLSKLTKNKNKKLASEAKAAFEMVEARVKEKLLSLEDT